MNKLFIIKELAATRQQCWQSGPAASSQR